MASRLELHNELLSLCNKVYFKPPSNMSYPCIKYSLNRTTTRKANDNIYLANKQYTITVIDPNPDSEIPDKLLMHFKNCSHDRTFNSDNLMHWVFTLYY